jgi:hypothetical protein
MRQISANTPPLALATLAGMIQGQALPVRTAHVRQSMAKRRGSKPHEQQPSTGTNRLAVTASMANPCEEIDAAKQSETFLRDLSTGKALLQRKVICWSEITKGSGLPRIAADATTNTIIDCQHRVPLRMKRRRFSAPGE